MEIEKLLSLEKWQKTETDFIGMVISNRIDYYTGDKMGAAVTSRNFGMLAEDILKWRDSKNDEAAITKESGCLTRKGHRNAMIIDQIPLSVQVSGAKKMSLNLNIYRNLHHQVNNKAKKRFVSIIRQNCQIEGVIESFPVELIYTIFRQNKRREDLMNIGAIIDKFVSDVLVELGYIPDDNMDYIKKVSFEDGGIDKFNPHARLEIREL